MAPLAVAQAKGHLADKGLEAQAGWSQLPEGLIDGAPDGAHTLAPQPPGAAFADGIEFDGRRLND